MSAVQTPTNLTSGDYWDEGYQAFTLSPMPDRYCTVQLMRKWLTAPGAGNGKSVFEMGVYPGRFMVHFGKAGYELNGIDQTQYLPQMEAWLREQHFKTGRFLRQDVFEIDRSRKYDVVFSAGFIEHFTNFEELVQLHADITAPGGCVYITAPNFGGRVQHWLHRQLDQENLAHHYVPSMDVQRWVAVLQRNGFEMLEAGYIGGFDFWAGDQPRRGWRKWLLKLIRWSLPVLRNLPLPNNRMYSPECVVLARKKS